jgi:hypothetical protein
MLSVKVFTKIKSLKLPLHHMEMWTLTVLGGKGMHSCGGSMRNLDSLPSLDLFSISELMASMSFSSLSRSTWMLPDS